MKLNPVTRKRLRRFRQNRRGFASLCILAVVYGLSLGSELLCNDRPLAVRHAGRWYFPVFRYHPDDTFTGSGHMTRPDYKAIAASESFRADPRNRMVFPLIPYGPNEQIDPQGLAGEDIVTVRWIPEARVGAVHLTPEGVVTRTREAGFFFDRAEPELRGLTFDDHWHTPPALRAALEARFANRAAPAWSAILESRPPLHLRVAASMPAYSPREAAPRTVQLLLRETLPPEARPRAVVFAPDGRILRGDREFYDDLPPAVREETQAAALARFERPVNDAFVAVHDVLRRVRYEREDVRFPHPPVAGHRMGIDHSGRDVFARVLYGTRTSLTFGLLLAGCATILGLLTGALQGYHGGVVDLAGQRFTEIWSAIPFLYVMILLGATLGRGFTLLLVTYGLFNWIGVSYYVRAEFLRLRRLAFVDAARCLGLGDRDIILRHILPNALVPVITYFPFSLVGAISALAALDYLGFGLPPPTASWGELLGQAQQVRWAWWLVLYPALALFAVILLCVFVGEAIRDAYDPRRFNRLD